MWKFWKIPLGMSSRILLAREKPERALQAAEEVNCRCLPKILKSSKIRDHRIDHPSGVIDDWFCSRFLGDKTLFVQLGGERLGTENLPRTRGAVCCDAQINPLVGTVAPGFSPCFPRTQRVRLK